MIDKRKTTIRIGIEFDALDQLSDALAAMSVAGLKGFEQIEDQAADMQGHSMAEAVDRVHEIFEDLGGIKRQEQDHIEGQDLKTWSRVTDILRAAGWSAEAAGAAVDVTRDMVNDGAFDHKTEPPAQQAAKNTGPVTLEGT